MASASLASLLRSLRAAGLDIDAEGAMDAAWLSVRLASRQQDAASAQQPAASSRPPEGAAETQSGTVPQEEQLPTSPKVDRTSPAESPSRRASRRRDVPAAADATIRLPVAAALPQSRLLARSLRPLRKRVPSAATELVLDIDRTVRRASEEGIWLPAFRPRPERWLDVAIVVDRSVSMLLWTDAVAELRRLLAWSGAFRSIATWWIQTDTTRPLVFRRQRDVAEEAAARKPGKLTAVARRGLVLVVTDCVSARWYDGSAIDQLREWSRGSLVAITQVLPQAFWARTALGEATSVQLRTPGEGVTNAQLRWTADFAWLPEEEGEDLGVPKTFVAPIVPLEPAAVLQFARLVAGRGTDTVVGTFFDLEAMRASGRAPARRDMDPKERVARFFSVSTASARRLAAALAASPVLSLRLLRLLRQELIPEGRRSHEAEVLLSGLVRVRGERQLADADDLPLEFVPGVRAHLLDSVTGGDAIRVLRHAAQQAARSLPEAQTFLAALDNPSDAEGVLRADSGDFMRLASEVLGRVGGAYGRVTVAEPEPTEEPDRPIGEGAAASAPDVQQASPDVPQVVTPDAGVYATPVDPFVNREAELTQLMDWWRDRSDVRPMFVTGPGGMGKTALAKQFVTRILADDPPDGGLLALSEPSWDSLPRIYEYFFGPPPRDKAGAKDLLVAIALTSDWRRRRLLVLDGGGVTGPEGRSLLSDFCAHFAPIGKLLVLSRSQHSVYNAGVIDLGPLNEAAVIDWMNRVGIPSTDAPAFFQYAQGRPSEIARALANLGTTTFDLEVQSELARLYGADVTPADRIARLEQLGGRSDLPPYLLVEVFAQLAIAYHRADRREEAERTLQHTRDLAEHVEDPERSATALRAAANAAEQFGDTWGAMELLERVLAQFERLAIDSEVADTLGSLVQVAAKRGELERAIEFGLKRVSILERATDRSARYRLMAAVSEVARLYSQSGRDEAAFEWFARSAAIAEEIPPPDLPDRPELMLIAVATALTNTARAAARLGREEDRQRYFRKALERYRSVGDDYMVELVEAQVAQAAVPAGPPFVALLLQSLSIACGRAIRDAQARYSDHPEHYGPWLRTREPHAVSVHGEFRLGLALVTNNVFRVFARERGYEAPEYWSPGVDPAAFTNADRNQPGPQSWGPKDFPKDLGKHPVSGICFEEALAFTRWLNVALPPPEGWSWSLPTEDMWEFAARGGQGFHYPWGNEFRSGVCNSREAGIGRTTPVDFYAEGRGPYGAYDFAGNVWEFVLSTDQPSHHCVLRGGSYLNTHDEVKSSLRLTGVPKDHRPPDFGFRLAMIRAEQVTSDLR